jgi:hypothetical protein
MPVYDSVSEACRANGAGVKEPPKLTALEQACYERIRLVLDAFEMGQKTWHQVKWTIQDAIETEEFEPWQPGQ